MLVCGLFFLPALAQVSAPTERPGETHEFDSVMRSLLHDLEALSDYNAAAALPNVYRLPQLQIEQRVCDAPCNVTAAYVPREGIYLVENLDPIREPLDRAALLHELVHYLQSGHPKFAEMTPCARDRAQEQEAYALQNAYLTRIGRPQRVTFYDGEFDCESEPSGARDDR